MTLVRRVLIDPSTYASNLGDLAMLQETVRRVSELWPSTRVEVLTDDAAGLHRHCPGATPVSTEARDRVCSEASPGRLGIGLISRLRGGQRRSDSAPPAVDLVERIKTCDLVIASGGGGTTDLFPDDARSLLSVLGLASGAGVCTAMMSQGFGPLEDRELARFARRVLPGIHLIALREDVASAAVLKALGVDRSRVDVTGDDTVSTARRHTRPELGTEMGVNVRQADYAGIDSGLAAEMGDAVRHAARHLGLGMRVVPIDVDPIHGDAAVTRRVCSIAGSSPPEVDPGAVMRAAGGCRLVVTASYHAAVFALAQGVPAVGVAASTYYANKFRGLAGMFGKGCEVVMVGPGWREHLAATVESVCSDAAQLRPSLVAAADRQVEMADRAYLRLRDIAEQAAARRLGA